MLVLTRRDDEAIIISGPYGDITITVVESQGKRVTFEVDLPEGVTISDELFFDYFADEKLNPEDRLVG